MDALQSAFAGTFEQFLEAMPDGIVIVGADGHILFANGRAEAVSGYSRSELLTMSVEELVPEVLRSRHASHRASYHVHPTVRPMGSQLDIRVRRKDGSEFPADIALSPVTTDLGLLVIASVRDITDRKQAEAKLLEAQERYALVEDRERIGRELHDGAIQALFAVGMGLQGAALMTVDASLKERLEGSVAQIDEVIRDLRNYIFGLRPGLAADRRLSQALKELAQQLEQQHGVPCAVDVDERLASRLSPRAGDIVQLTREALSNVGQHAAAITCRISLRQQSDRAVLQVEDDGRGFVPRESQGKGWGLRNLEQRAAALGGALEITSVPGEGTTVRFSIPL